MLFFLQPLTCCGDDDGDATTETFFHLQPFKYQKQQQAILEQFRRFANLYFLCIGVIMFIGYATPWYDTAVSPWTTLLPLSVVISISLIVEGFSDYKRHLNDAEVNNAPCVVLNRADALPAFKPKHNNRSRNSAAAAAATNNPHRDMTIMNGRDVLVNVNKAYYDSASTSVRGARQRINTDPNDTQAEMVNVCYQKLKRRDIRQGMFVLVRNRDMVPADLLLLASSNDQGGAYIETSSIDGETNLKLRNSPHLPQKLLLALRAHVPQDSIRDLMKESETAEQLKPEFETLEAATKRLTRFSALGRPDAASVLDHPGGKEDSEHTDHDDKAAAAGGGFIAQRKERRAKDRRNPEDEGKYVAALTTEPPNASVHTFSGKLTLPPFGSGNCYEIPLGADSVLLRGAIIRNTEWALGLAFFTGNDTKLVQNSFETPSKFSQLDRLMNKTVVFILCLMFLMISYLAAMAVTANNDLFDTMFYVGFNRDTTERWPYLPQDFEVPVWKNVTQNWVQNFFLFVTLVSNLIPLSLYVTVELVQFCMLWLIYVDLDMYDDVTDTRALARSTIVSDLGRIQYIFSDKTGTLTQNVMGFKRCSVDGAAYGSPIQRSRPGGGGGAEEDEEEVSSFHPLRQLMVGKLKRPSGDTAGLTDDNKLTFHAEMFLRVMSLCHTVVVEKDIENKTHISAGISASSSHGSSRSYVSFAKNMFGGRNRGRANTSDSLQSPLGSVAESGGAFDSLRAGRDRANTAQSFAPDEIPTTFKNSDGAPDGYAYQAESPDEGALVSAASLTYGFQVIARDMNGIRLRCPVVSHLQDTTVTDRLKSKDLSMDRLAADTAVSFSEMSGNIKNDSDNRIISTGSEFRDETWSILAVNKFDSDRKRMSILLRSPPELGSLPILFCKGADSAMLDPHVCQLNTSSMTETEGENIKPNPENEDGEGMDAATFGMAHMLGIQIHLGEFAREGLRTLVLGMRVLSDEECSEWLKRYEAAAVSLKNRGELLSDAAAKIEQGLHIVGATAIEDKLQKKVPETIATLAKAGIKLWVLTGDKRETAVEIGYSTHVLTSKMHLIEAPDNGKNYVRTQMSMEFLRMTKNGKLANYQTSALSGAGGKTFKQRVAQLRSDVLFRVGKCQRFVHRSWMSFFAGVVSLFGMRGWADRKFEELSEARMRERMIKKLEERRRNARKMADETVRLWMKDSASKENAVEGKSKEEEQKAKTNEESELTAEEVPLVFNRASTARTMLNEIKKSGKLSEMELRHLSLSYLTFQQAADPETHDQNLVDEDALSMESYHPRDLLSDFDRKKRTLLERIFAVDREVRKGRLQKHMSSERIQALTNGKVEPVTRCAGDENQHTHDGPKALVIEGAALKHLLGDPEFEEILFAVASSCDAVIACRVSPKQKALLVNLVRQNIDPEPITLAIGDGANDVGMIQEAHVGVGISGKEGKQAVNASDFAIAQFRFLETLILIHGRWDFFRLTTVVLFSFYKNAVMCGTIIFYSNRTVYSGTPLFNEWVVSMLNFVAAFPIVFTGLFDRCLSKKYIRGNPEVYRATRENELITLRTLSRWVAICLIHVAVLYYCTIPQQTFGGGITSAFVGLMRNNDPDHPGDGEGGDLLSAGTVTYTCMIFLLAYKVSDALCSDLAPPLYYSRKLCSSFDSSLAPSGLV